MDEHVIKMHARRCFSQTDEQIATYFGTISFKSFYSDYTNKYQAVTWKKVKVGYKPEGLGGGGLTAGV